MRYARSVLGFVLIFTLSMPGAAFAAAVYSDVSSSHWAYSAIERMADKGIMVGNLSGEYKPDDPIDKFETAKILAIASGFKYTGMTEEEQNYFDRAYSKNKTLIAGYASKYSKWNSTSDREIAYLLEKEILVESDLDQFILSSNSQENLRALSRQEAAVFLTKLMGKKQEALSGNYSYSFADDSKIEISNKPYVYYLKNAGVINGGTDNNFTPNGAVTRAAMAVMLDKAIEIMESTGGQVAGGKGTNPDVVSIETISGTITEVYTSLGAVQVLYPNGEDKIHKVDVAAGIYVDGFIKTIHDLKAGMPIVGILSNNVFTDIKAQAVTQATGAGAGKTQAAAIEYSTVQGVVKTLYDSGTEKVITIEVKIINPLGGVIVENNVYTLDSACEISRSGAATNFSSIVENDVVKAKVSGNKVYSIFISEKDRVIKGTVTDKRIDEHIGTKYYVIADEAGETHNLAATESTLLTRKEFGEVEFNDIRIGDTVELTAEYSTIVKAHADGVQSIKDGYIREIHMTQDGTNVIFRDIAGEEVLYRIIDGAFDVHTLRLNSKVRVRLDSKEIEMVTILHEAQANYYTGYIESIGSSSMVLRASNASNSETIKVNFDNATIVTDYTTSAKVTTNSLYRNMKVYVIFSDSSLTDVKSIAILEK